MPAESDDTSEYDRLARRYLDLWQNQLSGLAADPLLTEQIASLFAAANAQVAAAIQTAQGGPHAATHGTAPAAPSPGHGSADLGELRKRVAALEERIARLEARSADT